MDRMRLLGALALLLWRTAVATRRHGLPPRETLRALVEVGTRSLPLVLTGMAFFGAVLMVIAESQARKIVGNLELLGAPYFQLMVGAAGPLLAAILAASRVGAGMGAELATQKVTEQLDALELSAGDPLSELVAPRLLAGLFGVPLLAISGTLVSVFAAALTATWALGVDGRAFLDPRYLSAHDVWAGLIKTALAGLAVALCAAHAGLNASGGAPGVGEATHRGVVHGVVACLVIDFLVGATVLVIAG
jgi:phospholipid/cholesterol/gamma-HCH transport system permease protein